MPVANLIKYIRVEGKWKFVSVYKVNGAFRPTHVVLSGTPVKTDDGVFYLEWTPPNGKRTRLPVGKSQRVAMQELTRKQHELDNDPSAPKVDNRQTIEDACTKYLRDIKATRGDGTHRSYAAQTRWFQKHTTKVHVADITRDDIMELFAKGRDEGSDQKTINKRIVVILGALRNAGHDIKLKKGDWPKTADPDPEVFEHDDLQRFLEACDEREQVLFMTFLYTGFRHMEIATLQWNGDIDWRNHALKVRIKADLNFAPKSYEWRSVKVPKALIDLLREWHKKAEGPLVFPSLPHPKRPNYGGGKVDYHMLEACKRVGYRAGLNCNKCVTGWGKCVDGPYCGRFYLHKFRHTFATNMLHSGVDIKSLQTLLGHKSLATTERYLKSLRLHDLESKIENSTLAGLLQTVRK